jgi:hypothetical protein
MTKVGGSLGTTRKRRNQQSRSTKQQHQRIGITEQERGETRRARVALSDEMNDQPSCFLHEKKDSFAISLIQATKVAQVRSREERKKNDQSFAIRVGWTL